MNHFGVLQQNIIYYHQLPPEAHLQQNLEFNASPKYAKKFRDRHDLSIPVNLNFKEFSESLNISLIEIPKRATDQCQPLDCLIFGALKGQTKALSVKMIREFISQNNYFIQARAQGNDVDLEVPEMNKFKASALLDILLR